MIRMRQSRTRRSGHRHSMNEQDYPPTVYTPAQRAQFLRNAAAQFVGMVETWGAGRRAEGTAKAAALALVDVLRREDNAQPE